MMPRFFQHWLLWFRVLAGMTLVAGLDNVVRAEPMQLVLPSAYAANEAAGSAAWPQRLRYQNIYQSDLFDALPEGGGYLTNIRYRPDGLAFYSGEWSADELTISAAVTAQSPGDLHDNSTFGTNVTKVRATAPWQGGTQSVGPFGGPMEFDLEFLLDTPFRYNPAEGNLLIEFITQGPGLAPFSLDRLSDGDTSENAMIVAWSWPATSPVPTYATRCVGGMIAKFTFVQQLGDYNLDDVVDGQDFLVWQRTFGTTTEQFAGADGNGDGTVDAGDLTVWLQSYGTLGSYSLTTQANFNDVPEPVAFLLAVLAAVGTLSSRRQTVLAG